MEVMTVRNASGRPKQSGAMRCVRCGGCADSREGAHRLSAVADGGFLVVRHFAERPAVIADTRKSGRSRSRSARQVPSRAILLPSRLSRTARRRGAQLRARRRIAPSDRGMRFRARVGRYRRSVHRRWHPRADIAPNKCRAPRSARPLRTPSLPPSSRCR